MRINKILKKIHLEGKEFIISKEIREYCNALGADYYNTIRYLTHHGYLLRIFKGIFYVRDFEELKLGRIKYSHLELVSHGMELKGIKKWYFGLYTALKLNNATHEHFTVDYVISDRLFRSETVSIGGYKFKFVRLKGSLMNFGIIVNRLRYSDLEKTILDLIYLWRYNGTPPNKILMDISEYMTNASREKIIEYSIHYPKTVIRMLEGIN
ncbi:MAG: hypothetical protein KAU14_02690 [Thermoplasmata archaeon]|nr:hypothetical protein [Thermoplasmata archaeon]